ncbi:hypothetical protein JD844_016951 [Phrynosoma platyrhinos]|uniref:Transporter n=1 Tax=Phrynosoma platyrhinos TaxID=52577 RepID=A0ABQ7SL41_PHRPL|nr:hypothetical protein JD844_016951 [Phrynosoma platyrhinos]
MESETPADDSRVIADDVNRPKWDNKIQYLLSCIGFAVGFGNVWRFPYLCQTYGGGAFLIPYVIALVFEGIPIFHLELAIGQRLRKGSTGVWTQISPYLGGLELIEECHKSTATNFFWYRHTLNISADITQSGPLLWWMVLCLTICWIVVYICTIRGIESTGKAIYVTTTFPYLILTVFLIYGLTLPGAVDGLAYLFTPDAICWFKQTQVGILGNPRANDCEKDAIIIAAVNSLTSMYASIPIFSILGFKATMGYWDCLDRIVYSLLSASGAGLAFIVFTEAVVKMPGSQAWSVLFFIMLFNLGLSSMFGLVQGVLTPLIEFPTVTKYLTKEAVCGIICLLSFLLGLCFTLRSGSYWLEVFDGYVGSMPLLVIAFFEVIGVIFIYGMKRFCDDVKWMTGRPVRFYWKASWQIISPVLMAAIFLAYISIQRAPSYSAWNPDYEHFPVKEQKAYPGWIVFICALLAITPCAIIPMGAINHLRKTMWAKKEKQALHPSDNTNT